MGHTLSCGSFSPAESPRETVLPAASLDCSVPAPGETGVEVATGTATVSGEAGMAGENSKRVSTPPEV